VSVITSSNRNQTVTSPLGASSEDRLIRAIRNGAQDTIHDAGQQIVRRQLKVAPTLNIRPRFPVRIIVTRDLVLEPYGGGYMSKRKLGPLEDNKPIKVASNYLPQHTVICLRMRKHLAKKREGAWRRGKIDCADD
jgi:Bacterial conjugation TrbI-like protein